MLNTKRLFASSQLPTLPTVAVKLLELAKNPETEIRHVIDTIKSDPAISAKILKSANSTYFGFKSEIRAVERAVPLLGTTVSTTLALSFSLNDDTMTSGPIAEYYKTYWMQSVVQSCAAERLGQRISPAIAPEFFLAGLLTDIGRLALLKAAARDYVPVLELCASGNQSLFDTENTKLGTNHAEIGAQLMENWKLPEAISQSVRWHQATFKELDSFRSHANFQLIAAINTASAVGDYFCTDLKGRALERMRKLYTEYLGFTSESLDSYLQDCSVRIEQAAGLFSVDVAELGDPAELMVQANEQLVQLTLREHVASTQATIRHQEAEKEKAVLETQNRELQKQALHDPLTGVLNRNFFDESLEREINRGQRMAAPVAVIFADIDHFKKFNDTYGHQFGDTVLQQFAKAFQATLRTSDVLARYGGEEFVVLVSQPTEKGVERLAERIRERIASEKLNFNGETVHVTCSLGTAITIPGRREQGIARRLVAAADECLYEAKRGGRNQVRSKSLISDLDRQVIHMVTNQRFSRWLVAQGLLDVPTASRALLEAPVQPARIGELAEMYGYLTPAQIAGVMAEQEKCGDRFGAIAVRLGYLSLNCLVHLLTLQQENPKQLAAVIIRLGLLAPEQAARALEQYIATQVPEIRHQPMASMPELVTAN
ncbi:MAG TPA: diguanylate cyclase [Planctomycetaceae bacterium]|nr:diguanylate cyclase [Planctomycetaceae bacterium]